MVNLGTVADALHNRTIEPMKGKADAIPRSDQWVYELKWDGMRVLAFVLRGTDGEDNRVRLQSSNGRDITNSFPELQALAPLADLFDGVVLDGEVVAFDGAKPSFNTLQTRIHVTDPADAARRANQTPVLFVVFDLLHLDGHDTMALPLTHRRALLEQISDDDPCWTICEQHEDNVDGLVQAVIDSELEGIVAKNINSTYQPGRRSPDWIKVKPRMRQEFVVGGWLGGKGSRTGGLGSLLVGYYDGDEFHYAGRAGSGLTDATQREWQTLLSAETCGEGVVGERAQSPFVEPPTFPRDKVVHWCEPTEIVEIAFGEWGGDGHHLRHPVVLGRRTDKDPKSVVRET